MVQWYHRESTERKFVKRNRTIKGILKKIYWKYLSLTTLCFMLLKKVCQTFPLAFRKFRVRVRQGDGLNSSFLIRSPWLMKTYGLKQCTCSSLSTPLTDWSDLVSLLSPENPMRNAWNYLTFSIWFCHQDLCLRKRMSSSANGAVLAFSGVRASQG